MQEVLRYIGNAFLSAANALGESRDAIHAYLFDVAFQEDRFINQDLPIVPSRPPNYSRVGSRILIFPSPARFDERDDRVKR
ncbi:MAG: hypothetical protein ACYC7J_20010 [Syntrophales bacterium]